MKLDQWQKRPGASTCTASNAAQ